MSILSIIGDIEDLEYTSSSTLEQIRKAENILGMKFPEEYSDYLIVYGSISFNNISWTGLNTINELNVVDKTLKERSENSAFPKKFFVLEDLHKNNKKIIVNEEGQVYIIQGNQMDKLYNSLEEYLEFCLYRNL